MRPTARVPSIVVQAAPAEELPKLTPALTRDAATMCGLRLRLAYQGLRGNRSSGFRYRVRSHLVEQARVAHAQLVAPTRDAFVPLPDYFPEEQAVFRGAADGYEHVFADLPARSVDVYEWETRDEDRGVRLVGGLDLLLEDGDGTPELRVLVLDGPPAPGDPLADPGVRFAALRLRALVGERPVVWRHAALLPGTRVDCTIDLAAIAPALDEWLDERLATVRRRVEHAAPRIGAECGWCRYVGNCPAVK